MYIRNNWSLTPFIHKLKGKVTILFITHQLPKGLKVDDAVILGKTDNDKTMNQDKVL